MANEWKIFNVYLEGTNDFAFFTAIEEEMKKVEREGWTVQFTKELGSLPSSRKCFSLFCKKRSAS